LVMNSIVRYFFIITLHKTFNTSYGYIAPALILASPFSLSLNILGT
jgi:hypothetical protein